MRLTLPHQATLTPDQGGSLTRRRFLRGFVAVAASATTISALAACGGASQDGIRTVSSDQAFDTLFENPPEGLVVLDVRTPDEFNAQRLPDATMIDFYEADFADRIADLDPDAPYLLYCRSGNRSGQTRAIMGELGFTNVQDIEGGIVSWLDDGHPFVTSND